MDLYKRVRSRPVLHRAWARVRESGMASESEATKLATRRFDANWLANLERIRSQLKDEAFSFDGERGVALPKGKNKAERRPLVIAPIANRVVRRAILDVLQGYGGPDDLRHQRWGGVPGIRRILETPTSIGGIKERGVAHGLRLICDAVGQGKTWFARTDIRNFFTRIDVEAVRLLIEIEVENRQFGRLFADALATNLVNQDELEERGHFKLFPDQKIGVAQGSALSALAGNIVLREFDAELNDRGIVCVRYIDDLILLGPSSRHVRQAFKSARDKLSRLGMDAYDIDNPAHIESGKADFGDIYKGTDVLGYHVRGTRLQPCAAARRKFLQKIDEQMATAFREMQKAAAGKPYEQVRCYHHALAQIHKIIWGWSQSFRYTTERQVFETLDEQIAKRLTQFQRAAEKLCSGGCPKTFRRVMGMHLLTDTVVEELPSLSLD